MLFADALMNTSPWDYWEADGRTPKGQLGEAVAAIEGVLAANPDHPGAIHMYIHLTEASATPEKAEPLRRSARRPDARGRPHRAHAVAHLLPDRPLPGTRCRPTSPRCEADEAYLAQAQAKAAGIYPYSYYPHNIHFALVSAQMAGDAEHMVWAAERLNGKIPDEVAGEVGWIQAILPAPYFAHAQFSPPDVVLGLADPGDKFPFVRAMWHYARGVAHAAKGDLDAARAEADADLGDQPDGRFRDAARLVRAGAGHPAHRASCPRGAHRAGGGQPRPGDQGVRGGGADPGLAALHGAGVLVLSGPPVARRDACSWPGAPRRR